nr:BAG family molecular chaperone regulator 1 [Jaculus jaculus]
MSRPAAEKPKHWRKTRNGRVIASASISGPSQASAERGQAREACRRRGLSDSGESGEGGVALVSTPRRSATTAGRSTNAGLAERGGGGGARGTRGDREPLGPRRRVARLGREPRQSEPGGQRGPPPSLRSSGRNAAGGHERAARGAAAAGACRPRLKKKVRPSSTPNEKATRSKEETRSKKVIRSKEEIRSKKVTRSKEVPLDKVVTLAEEVTQTEKVTQVDEVTQTDPVTQADSVTQADPVTQTEEMAETGLSVTVTHSNEKYDLHVTPQQGSSEPIVQDLAQVVEEATGVPVPFQKLIFKGKSLKEMETPLSALGMQDGCRVMLIGEKSNPEEEVELKKLKDLEASVAKVANHLEELNKELAGIQQGFLAKDLQAEALSKLDRRVKATMEQFMKILEEIDTMVLPENFKDSRLKRKSLVQKVQAFLAECDMAEQNICQETERLQSTNLALSE